MRDRNEWISGKDVFGLGRGRTGSQTDLLTKLLEESWYPLAHLESTSEQPAWCASWACVERLREGVVGTPDASVRTVGERVTYLFLLPEWKLWPFEGKKSQI